jgi:hypothetical protein
MCISQHSQNVDQSDPAPSFLISRRSAAAVAGLMAASLLQGCRKSGEHRMENDRLAADLPNCFVKGTRILTPTGYRPIEELLIGEDIVLLGQERRKINWIGTSRRSISAARPRSAGYSPVCFSKGSLGGGFPSATLRVSRDHRLYRHGMLIRAFEFVNGHSIAFESQTGPAEIDYFHILVEGEHGILFAEGVPCETLLFSPRTIPRFDNSGAFEHDVYKRPAYADRPYAPVFASNDSGYRALISSHLRIALSPLIERRTQADKVQQMLLALK